MKVIMIGFMLFFYDYLNKKQNYIGFYGFQFFQKLRSAWSLEGLVI